MLIIGLALISNVFAANNICTAQFGFSKNLLRVKQSLIAPEDSSCQPLKVGAARNFNIDHRHSPTTVEQRYELTRISEKQYKIRFNISFYAEENQEIDSTKNLAYSFVWRNLANDCLAKLGNSLKGPNGESLRMEIENPEVKNSVPKTEVGLVDEGRANSHAWEKKMDCATVLHELLHLTGLVDEYKETESGYSHDPISGQFKWKKNNAELLAYDCRKLAKEDSIMSTQNAMWRLSQATKKNVLEFCKCGYDQSKCDQYTENKRVLYKKLHPSGTPFFDGPIPEELKNPKVCPVGFVTVPGTHQEIALFESEQSVGNPGAYGYNVPDGIKSEDLLKYFLAIDIQPRPESERISMLSEKHWNAIIFPGCWAKNIDYYLDSQDAYRTSFEHGGKGCYHDRKPTTEKLDSTY